jgi:hypothetical protein
MGLDYILIKVKGVPEREALYLKKIMGLNVFVETGTYYGYTALRMSKIFDKVYTIEKSEALFNKAKEKLGDVRNVTLIYGDSREELGPIIEREDNILFWLDAHWSGGETYGESDQCPLIKELEVIFRYSKKKNFAILIDDARLFLAPPPSNHDFSQWPTIRDICEIVPTYYCITIHNDVICVIPNEICTKFKSFLQDILQKDWEKISPNISTGIKVIVEGMKMIIKGVLTRRIR